MESGRASSRCLSPDPCWSARASRRPSRCSPGRDRASGFHHDLGQPGREWLLSVEAPASRCVVRRISRPAAHANHLVFSQFADIDQEIAPSSASRQRRAEALISAGVLEGGDPLVVLGDSSDGDHPICRKRRDGPDSGYTLASSVFAFGSEQVDWRAHPHPLGAAEHSGSQRAAGEPPIGLASRS